MSQGSFNLTTKNNYALDEVVSALTKEVRRGNEDDALFWALEMIESGYARYFWRRLGVLVAEDVGLADGGWGVVLVNNAAAMFERRIESWSKGPNTIELVGVVILYLCRAPKSGECSNAAYAVQQEREAGRREEVPPYALDMHTARGRQWIRQMGLSKNEEEKWWYEELEHRENLKPGNSWIRRYIEADKLLTDPKLREELIAMKLLEYGETEDSQL
jgi:replication-associated recombination protein RarA